ncbi:hypothetical protein [Viridibacillus arvi]|uniref:hypothetical protein n=1 Tax=Viridibacillus arvi TaxID=263475 RepID=UPI003D0120ED
MDRDIYKVDYTETQVVLFYELDKKALKLNIVKNFSMLIFIGMLFFSQLYYEFGFLEKIFEGKTDEIGVEKVHFEGRFKEWLVIIVAIICYPLIVKLIKKALYHYISGDKNLFSKNKTFGIRFLLSPDAYYAQYYKGKLKRNFFKKISDLDSSDIYYTKEEEKMGINSEDWNQIKIVRKFFIEWSNWTNIFITVTFCVVSLILIYLFCNIYWVAFWFTLLIYRLISRGVEIAKSFYKDVANTKAKIFYKKDNKPKYILDIKSSLIRSHGRLSLAMHSLIELIILYSCLYFTNSLLHTISDINIFTPFNSLLFSASLGVFNISFDFKNDYSILPQSIFHVSQVILSVILILLSIAQYLGKNDSLSKYDEDLYLKVELKKQENKSDEKLRWYKSMVKKTCEYILIRLG